MLPLGGERNVVIVANVTHLGNAQHMAKLVTNAMEETILRLYADLAPVLIQWARISKMAPRTRRKMTTKKVTFFSLNQYILDRSAVIILISGTRN